MSWPDGPLPQVRYQGRWWDAPITDDAAKADLTGQDCVLCSEPIVEQDDALFTPFIHAHLECYLRQAMGDVQHLEGRCLCSRGSQNEITYPSDIYASYRDSARATLRWLLEHRRGRFHS